jgi:transposase
LFLHEQKKRLNAQMRPLIRQAAPDLLEVFGVGFDVAAKLLIAAGDNPHRIRSEAAWARLCGVAPIATLLSRRRGNQRWSELGGFGDADQDTVEPVDLGLEHADAR